MIELDYTLQQETMVAIQDLAAGVAEAMQRPSVLYRPTLTVDGNQYCMLYGVDLQEGIAGFGDTAALAAEDFDKNWDEMTAPKQGRKL